MKIVITESQFENVKKLTYGLVILDESHDKYKDILSDEDVEEIIKKHFKPEKINSLLLKRGILTELM
jgi:isopentenyl phosphate kinase